MAKTSWRKRISFIWLSERLDPVNVGNKYTIFRGTRLITHPVTGRKIGRKYLITGIVQVIDQQGNFYTGKITEAFHAVEIGDMLRHT
jgi:hypothetical protein